MRKAFSRAFDDSKLSAQGYAELLSRGVEGDEPIELSGDQVYRYASGRTVIPAGIYRRVARVRGMGMDELYAIANGLPTPNGFSDAAALEVIRSNLTRMLAQVDAARGDVTD